MALTMTVNWKDIVASAAVPVEITHIINELLNDEEKLVLASSYMMAITQAQYLDQQGALGQHQALKQSAKAIEVDTVNTPLKAVIELIEVIMKAATVDNYSTFVQVDGETGEYSYRVLTDDQRANSKT